MFANVQFGSDFTQILGPSLMERDPFSSSTTRLRLPLALCHAPNTHAPQSALENVLVSHHTAVLDRNARKSASFVSQRENVGSIRCLSSICFQPDRLFQSFSRCQAQNCALLASAPSRTTCQCSATQSSAAYARATFSQKHIFAEQHSHVVFS
jgi:hypothetical protein